MGMAVNQMGMSQTDGKMEGWLCIVRSNRFGLQNSRMRYFVLEDHHLKIYKSIPNSKDEVTSASPIKSAVIDSCIRVTDEGRESIHRKVFYIFTLYNTGNHSDRLKLGASSSEEAARWIHSFKEAALKMCPIAGINSLDCPKNIWQSFRIHHSNSTDWAMGSSSRIDPTTSDVIAPSPWTIFGCQNGLRLFKEAKDREFNGKWDDHPAIMAVSVIDGTSEAIFRTVMSLGPSRSQWDFSFYRGNVVEHLDGHTDIIHKQLFSNWLPWGMKRRDLLLRRYWRRDDDGTYVILYHSVYHKKCPPQKGYVRACLKSGGYLITPINHGKQSVVKHMLAIDWKYWKAYLLSSSARYITIRMLERVAALRELFRAKAGDYSSDFLSGNLLFCNEAHTENRPEFQTFCESRESKVDDRELDKSEHGSLVGLDDVSDEFYDVPEQSDYDMEEEGWPSDCGQGACLQLGIDIGSSTVARGVVSLVLGYLNNLVIELAFLIQANTEEELPEQLLGTCRLNHLDASKAVLLAP